MCTSHDCHMTVTCSVQEADMAAAEEALKNRSGKSWAEAACNRSVTFPTQDTS